MRIRISACQFRVEPISNFKGFKKQVVKLLDKVPTGSDIVVFPELFTIGLLTTYGDFEQISNKKLTRIDEFTNDYCYLFLHEAVRRGQTIIAGSHLEYRDNKYYNTCHVFTPEKKEYTHRKTHIFPAEATWNTSEGNDIEIVDLGSVKIGISICYETQIPEMSRILAIGGADIIVCPSFTFNEHGFWRLRHCAHSRCIENQVYFVHCCTVGEPGHPLPNGYGRSSILSPCDMPWCPNGVVAEAETNKNMVITGDVDLDLLNDNRSSGATATFNDRTRRAGLYAKYRPYSQFNR